jgi:hypothetical protein
VKVPFGELESGERVSNAWETFPSMGDNSSNELLIPHTTSGPHGLEVKGGALFGELPSMDDPASH